MPDDTIFPLMIYVSTPYAAELCVVLYLLLINLTAAVLVARDKRRAVAHAGRVPERVFFALAFLGAGFGETAAIYLVRHKTRHRTFTIGIPVITVLVYGLALWLFLTFK